MRCQTALSRLGGHADLRWRTLSSTLSEAARPMLLLNLIGLCGRLCR